MTSYGPRTPRQALSSFVQRTGMHAVPSIASDRSRPSRIGWTILLMIAVTFLLHQILSICEKIRSYPTSTVTTVKYDSPMTFPAVTFCNLNPLRMDKVDNLQNEGYRMKRSPQRRNQNKEKEVQGKPKKAKEEESKLESKKTAKNKDKEKKERKTEQKKKKRRRKSQKDTINEIVNLVKPSFPTYDRGAGNFSRKKQNTKKLREDTVRKGRVMYLMNTLPEETIQLLTYDLMHVVVDCSFQGRNCDFERDFVRVMNPRLGACYIFNSGMNESKVPVPSKKIFNSGTDNGLELTLFVDVDNYLPDVAPAAGYKVLVHDQKTPPIPDQDGFVLLPGSYTTLGLRASEIERAVLPYGNCRHFSKTDNESMNMYLDSLPLTSPTMTTCMRTCEQLEILSKCGCFSLQHGYSTAPAFVAFNSSINDPCSLDDDSPEYNCTRIQLASVNQEDSYCKKVMCKNHECFLRRFEVSQSIASWPTKNSFAKIQRDFRKVNVDIKTYTNLVRDASSVAKANFANNFLKVLVFFEDLNVINIKTMPSYTWIDFLSDLGGQGGLWLGMSAFTIIEVLVLLIELVRLTLFCCFKGTEKEEPSPANLEEQIALEDKENASENA